MKAVVRTAAVFGSVDGLVLVLSLILGMMISRQSDSAVWHAALAGGSGELGGMSLGKYQSEPEDGKAAAGVCGLAGLVSVVVPGLPFLLLHGEAAFAAGLLLAFVVSAGIAWARPEHGSRAVARTYVLLLAATGLATLSGLL